MFTVDNLAAKCDFEKGKLYFKSRADMLRLASLLLAEAAEDMEAEEESPTGQQPAMPAPAAAPEKKPKRKPRANIRRDMAQIKKKIETCLCEKTDATADDIAAAAGISRRQVFDNQEIADFIAAVKEEQKRYVGERHAEPKFGKKK